MSRTTFATRVTAAVGMPPIDYLTRPRMLMAAKRLAEPGARVPAVGRAVGYESESAFNSAFERGMGSAPRRYAQKSATGSLGTDRPVAN